MSVKKFSDQNESVTPTKGEQEGKMVENFRLQCGSKKKKKNLKEYDKSLSKDCLSEEVYVTKIKASPCMTHHAINGWEWFWWNGIYLNTMSDPREYQLQTMMCPTNGSTERG